VEHPSSSDDHISDDHISDDVEHPSSSPPALRVDVLNFTLIFGPGKEAESLDVATFTPFFEVLNMVFNMVFIEYGIHRRAQGRKDGELAVNHSLYVGTRDSAGPSSSPFSHQTSPKANTGALTDTGNGHG
jgi:hypothetical protein